MPTTFGEVRGKNHEQKKKKKNQKKKKTQTPARVSAGGAGGWSCLFVYIFF
jgi:hypothetical protein